MCPEHFRKRILNCSLTLIQNKINTGCFKVIDKNILLTDSLKIFKERLMNTVTCDRCGYTWMPRVENPKSCPKCRYYFKETKNEEAKIGCDRRDSERAT